MTAAFYRARTSSVSVAVEGRSLLRTTTTTTAVTATGAAALMLDTDGGVEEADSQLSESIPHFHSPK